VPFNLGDHPPGAVPWGAFLMPIWEIRDSTLQPGT
jgi:hypothetical protein